MELLNNNFSFFSINAKSSLAADAREAYMKLDTENSLKIKTLFTEIHHITLVWTATVSREC